MKTNTIRKLARKFLKEHPELKQMYLAIDEFKKTGNQTTSCKSCHSLIMVSENKLRNVLETFCFCGKCESNFPIGPFHTIH